MSEMVVKGLDQELKHCTQSVLKIKELHHQNSMKAENIQARIAIQQRARAHNLIGRLIPIPGTEPMKPDRKIISKTVHLEPAASHHSRNPELDACSDSARKTAFRSRKVQSIGRDHTITPSSQVKLKIKPSLKKNNIEKTTTVKSDEPSHHRQHSDHERHVMIYDDVMSTKGQRKEPHGLNFFEKPKISGLAMAKIMKKMMGCEQEDDWNQYWKNVEKKISAIEAKGETLQPDQSTEDLFATNQ